jgi:hypothetical protein
METTINSAEEKIHKIISHIENKPHAVYIRYLLTKRYSPRAIKGELFRLGLSAPHEPSLTAYYLAVIDPVIRKYGLSELYATFKGKVLSKSNKPNDFSKDILNYRLHIGDDKNLQMEFNKMVKELNIDDCWIGEIFKYHASVEDMPVDENGLRILQVTNPNKNIEKILMNKNRYIIDKLILENVPDSRIAKYCREQWKLAVSDVDIRSYKVQFFNVKTRSIEENIHILENEINSMKEFLSDLNNTENYSDMTVGELMMAKKQTEERLVELEDNYKTLTSMYSEFAFKSATEMQYDFEEMFRDVVSRAYKRFCDLDAFKDRDVVDPLMKTAKIMQSAHDKYETVRDTSKNSGNGNDRHSGGVMMELYRGRLDEIAKEQIEKANQELQAAGIDILDADINPELIGGIEELGMNFETNEEENE